MDSSGTIKTANEFARDYENYLSTRNWHGPIAMFEMMVKYLREGQKLLDIGIGTGLSSILFHEAGLDIYGIDGSNEMLKICSGKGCTKHLKLSDITKEPITFNGIQFDFVISHALFHLTGKLESVFEDVYNILISGGIFCFSVIPYNKEVDKGFRKDGVPGIYAKKNEESDILNFRHRHDYVKQVLREKKLSLLQQSEIIGFIDKKERKEIRFAIYLAQKEK
ncbi:MAG: class I SAM-dependent DNA methyltransferase [Bacteroidota bacterium]